MKDFKPFFNKFYFTKNTQKFTKLIDLVTSPVFLSICATRNPILYQDFSFRSTYQKVKKSQYKFSIFFSSAYKISRFSKTLFQDLFLIEVLRMVLFLIFQDFLIDTFSKKLKDFSNFNYKSFCSYGYAFSKPILNNCLSYSIKLSSNFCSSSFIICQLGSKKFMRYPWVLQFRIQKPFGFKGVGFIQILNKFIQDKSFLKLVQSSLSIGFNPYIFFPFSKEIASSNLSINRFILYIEICVIMFISIQKRSGFFIKLSYFRFEDSFIIFGFKNSKQVIFFQNQLATFMGVSIINSSIVNLFQNYLFYLGFFIKYNKACFKNSKKIPLILIRAPVSIIVAQLKLAGYFVSKKNGSLIQAKSIPHLTHKEHYLILKHYNSIVFNLLGYYRHVDNYNNLFFLVNQLKHSCALTLALKYRFRRRSQVFKQFGTLLRDPISNITFLVPRRGHKKTTPSLVSFYKLRKSFSPSNLMGSDVVFIYGLNFRV